VETAVKGRVITLEAKSSRWIHRDQNMLTAFDGKVESGEEGTKDKNKG
jgi:hypothetical protein